MLQTPVAWAEVTSTSNTCRAQRLRVTTRSIFLCIQIHTYLKAFLNLAHVDASILRYDGADMKAEG